jgi:hypothetical protein
MQIVYTCNAVTCREGIYARHFRHSVACIGQHDVAPIGVQNIPNQIQGTNYTRCRVGYVPEKHAKSL